MPGSLLMLLLACAAEPTPAPDASPPPTSTASTPATPPVAASVVASDGLVRAVPPASPSTAAFMVLRNDADHDLAVVGASSPAARAVELHTHVSADGMMQMRRVDRFDLPAGGELRLGSGGPHIMLIGLEQDLDEGSSVPLTLRFDDGSVLSVDLPVKAPGEVPRAQPTTDE